MVKGDTVGEFEGVGETRESVIFKISPTGEGGRKGGREDQPGRTRLVSPNSKKLSLVRLQIGGR